MLIRSFESDTCGPSAPLIVRVESLRDMLVNLKGEMVVWVLYWEPPSGFHRRDISSSERFFVSGSTFEIKMTSTK